MSRYIQRLKPYLNLSGKMLKPSFDLILYYMKKAKITAAGLLKKSVEIFLQNIDKAFDEMYNIIRCFNALQSVLWSGVYAS